MQNTVKITAQDGLKRLCKNYKGNGTGVAGAKYDQDAYWATERYYANNHPLKRLPIYLQHDWVDYVRPFSTDVGGVLAGSAIVSLPIWGFLMWENFP